MSNLRKFWRVGWRIGVCLLLLAWIFHVIFLNEGQLSSTREGLHWDQLSRAEKWHKAWTEGPRELWRTLSQIHPFAFAGSLGVTCVALFLGVVRWRMVLKVQGLDLSLKRATSISWVAHFFNSFLLGSTGGDLIKAYYAARETHHKKTEAVVTVFVDRLVGLWAMLLFGTAMLLPNFRLLINHPRLGALGGFMMLMLFALTIVLGIAFWGGVSRRFPKARVYLRRLPKGDLLERSLDSCREFGRDKMFLLRTNFVSAILNTLWVVQVMILAAGLGLHIPTLALFAIVPTVFCISALPITPSGLGVRENLFVLMLAVPGLDVPATSALSISLLSFASGLFWSIVGGVVYLGLKEKEHLEEVTKPEQVTENV